MQGRRAGGGSLPSRLRIVGAGEHISAVRDCTVDSLRVTRRDRAGEGGCWVMAFPHNTRVREAFCRVDKTRGRRGNSPCLPFESFFLEFPRPCLLPRSYREKKILNLSYNLCIC